MLELRLLIQVALSMKKIPYSSNICARQMKQSYSPRDEKHFWQDV